MARVSLRALLCCAASAQPSAGTNYQHYRFTATAVRSDPNMIQFSELVLLQGGNPLPQNAYTDAMGGLSQGNTQKDPNSAEGAKKVIDGNKDTKWLSGDFDTVGWNAPLYVSLSQPTAISGVTFDTADDSPERDPVAWTVDGCTLGGFIDCMNNGAAWTRIATGNGAPTQDRKAPSGVQASVAGGGPGPGPGPSPFSPGGAPAGEKKAGGTSSAATAFLCIVFVGGFVYVAAGFAYNRKYRGKEGAEAIPHVEFWKDLPKLVKDGASFAARKARGDGGYNAV